jgi:transposase
MKVCDEERRELQWAAHHAPTPYVRVKSLALLNLADGRAVAEVAGIFQVSRTSLYAWQRRFAQEGVPGLSVRPGRGRKAVADGEEIARYVRRSPREFGLRQTRWTLKALAEVVPSLKGFSPFGVQKALARAGFRYKRGQPWLHSPDPKYEEKKGLWTKR